MGPDKDRKRQHQGAIIRHALQSIIIVYGSMHNNIKNNCEARIKNYVQILIDEKRNKVIFNIEYKIYLLLS